MKYLTQVDPQLLQHLCRVFIVVFLDSKSFSDDELRSEEMLNMDTSKSIDVDLLRVADFPQLWRLCIVILTARAGRFATYLLMVSFSG